MNTSLAIEIRERLVNKSESIIRCYTNVVSSVITEGKMLSQKTKISSPVISFAHMYRPDHIKSVHGFKFDDVDCGTVLYSFGEHKRLVELSPEELCDVADLIYKRSTEIRSMYQ